MSTEITNPAGILAGTVTPPAAPPGGTVSAVPPVTAPAAPPAPPAPPAGDQGDPAWLAGRLARERAKALSDAGFATEAEAKAAGLAAKAASDATKSAEQRAVEATQSAASEKARADQLLGVATEHAARMMVGLTPEQQKAVKDIAGDDPAKTLQTIGALVPTWAQADAAAAAAGGAAKTAATTAPAASAPAGTVPAQPTARATYEAMREQNPFAAANFGLSNPNVYDPK